MKQENMSRNKQLVINMSASFVSFAVSLFISFFLSPYIVRTLGVEANGFIGLANNFVNYASIITIALNSMAGRYITIAYVKGEKDTVNKYFSSVFYANVFIAIVLGMISVLCIVFLEKIVSIPVHLVHDVRLLFGCLFINCLISIVGSVFAVAPFSTNKLYLESLRTIESNLARALVILSCFALFNAKVWYVGLGTLVAGIYVLICNLYYTRTLLSEVEIRRSHFNFRMVMELVSYGIWNTVNRIGQLLADGLDLLVTNLLINSTAMGVLALAKTVPSLITGLMGSVVGVFAPNFTILYAEGDMKELIKTVKQSMKIMGIITNLPIIVLIVCGQDFFRLWQPTQDPKSLQILSLLTIGTLIFSGGINCLYNLFTVVNKVKVNAIVVVITSFASTLLVFILLKTTNFGIYAVAGVSTVLSIFRNLIFTAPYGAKCLNMKWYTFYPDIFRPAIFTTCSSLLGLYLLQFSCGNWFLLIGKGCMIGVISVLIGYFIVLNKEDRNVINIRLLRRIKS